ncbi:MAG: hypothetical protein D4R57_01825 [Verrucomicrobiales bacterium]|nr:MAG: hypothetical protein D4R57_01825 [Verrucomicrobiales bacterium]
MVIGNSDWSVDGNKTSTNYGQYDFWVLRLDSTGSKIWEKTFGGSQTEFAGDIQQTKDGGFILAGYSYSEADGNKSSPKLGPIDAWVIRLDSDGNKLWEQTYGGTNGALATRVVQTTNGGFIIGGSLWGGFGSWDYWLIALDADGNKLWDRIYGGDDEDVMRDMKQTADGGFVLSGYSYSDLTGNKTSPLQAVADAWVVRVDADGNKLWDQSIGAEPYSYAESITETTDGGFAFGGATGSFDVDAWLVRLDGNGNKLWDRSYGGSGEDRMASVLQLLDGGFLLGCYSGSDDGDRVGAVFNNVDYWIIRTDPLGNKLWDLSLGGTNREELVTIESTSDGGFILGGTSYSPTSGNKTNTFFGGIDYWLVKLGTEGPCDSDQDGVSDDEDQCSNTSPGAVVNSHGCSIEQIVPCDGPWKNHGQYVQAMTKSVGDFIKTGLIARRQGIKILEQATKADCGKSQTPRPCPPEKKEGKDSSDKESKKRPRNR